MNTSSSGEEVAMRGKKIPSLLDLCIQTAIDNLRYMGDIGDVDTHLLKDILPHCTVDQLMRIENSTQGRDLSSVTDDLWKRFYEKQFGAESADVIIQTMKQKKVVFNWKQLYETKTNEREQFQNRVVEKIRQRYQEDLAKKSSRRTQFTNKTPGSGSKRSYFSTGSSYNVSHMKSNIMKKAKIEYLNSLEAKNNAAMRKIALQRRSFPPQSTSRPTIPSNSNRRKDLGSSYKMANASRR